MLNVSTLNKEKSDINITRLLVHYICGKNIFSSHFFTKYVLNRNKNILKALDLRKSHIYVNLRLQLYTDHPWHRYQFLTIFQKSGT